MVPQLRGRAGSLADPKNLNDLENYYKSIKKSILENQFEFIIKKKEKNRTLLVNLKEKSIHIYKLSKRGNKKKFKKYLISDIEKILKDKQDNKEILVFRKSGKKELKLSFINPERRECFYELIWLLMLNKPLPIEEEKASHDRIQIFISTWNMGDAPPPYDEETLSTWIPKNKYDLYVIGVQECEYTPRKQFQECQDDWFYTLASHLGHSYYRVEGTSLVKMRIVIFAKKEHYYKINYIEKKTIGTGIGNIYGNKGATMISLHFFETSFCFISSHFAAHQEKTEARNNNYKDIVKGVEMGNDDLDILNQFNYVFWMGDFNYRIDGLFREEVLLHIKNKNITKLLKYDQLSNQKQQEKVFLGFKEELINFLPTYKTERGIENCYTNTKLRIPSWCDRILFKTLPYSHPITCTEYKSATKVTTSDHVPVFGVYESFVRMPCSPIPITLLLRRCQIFFYDLRAEGLDLVEDDRPPDAHIVFASNSFIQDDIVITHAYKNRNPVFGDLPPIVPIISRQSYLETQHLFLTFFHEDIKLGHAAVPLGIGFNPTPFSFRTRITKNGLNAGTLLGSIHIVYLDNPITSNATIVATTSSLGKSTPELINTYNSNSNNSSPNSSTPPLPPRTWLINNNNNNNNNTTPHSTSSTTTTSTPSSTTTTSTTTTIYPAYPSYLTLEPNSNTTTPILSPNKSSPPPNNVREYLARGLSTASIELDDYSVDDHNSIAGNSPPQHLNSNLNQQLERKHQLRRSV
ncbi:hypothetical protein DICPUDRAFT_156222 [Dictyostelium purpureum]|uniref:phosphatidylinositol-3,4,5-trisphosphate 5-phosphatase n=1 Tax=Dictyostelium purpureum TaxID=5786 RepID=F0ZW13_DICPU|nr:uncharacterized protein DICPUDRAFT_156222 [Dictyostelium purpureum]EGC31877.1 hypothetical protein DICPUDRAFT_156222 [Dictyostelium purpureum]|eukprot:XP_003291611.1 hypothetical protein DICPUDRAFT_156222 [Dictyostelium purpureum]